MALMNSIDTKVSGIYQIRNISNNHTYVGSAVDIKQRWYEHVSHLRTHKHHSIYLQRAWNKYGEDSFEFSIIEICSKPMLISREQYYIDNLAPSYNIAPTAGSQLGTRRSEKSKRKMSNSQRNRTDWWWTGKSLSVEHREKIRKSSKGRTSWNKGKVGVYSEDTIKRMRESKNGKVESSEHRRKISDAMKLYWQNKKGSHERFHSD